MHEAGVRLQLGKLSAQHLYHYQLYLLQHQLAIPSGQGHTRDSRHMESYLPCAEWPQAQTQARLQLS